MSTMHFGKTIQARSGRIAVHACNGRATSNPFSVTDEPAHVTCKRCLAKLPETVLADGSVVVRVGGEKP